MCWPYKGTLVLVSPGRRARKGREPHKTRCPRGACASGPLGCRKMVMAALGVTGELLARDGAGDREPLWVLSTMFQPL